MRCPILIQAVSGFETHFCQFVIASKKNEEKILPIEAITGCS